MLSAKQKKFIRKNVRDVSLNELSQKLNTPPSEINQYLKKIWRKDKYAKYLSKTEEKDSSSNDFKIKNWLKQNWYIILGLTFLIFVVYINGLGGAFVSDDINWIPNNPDIGNFRALFKWQNRPAIWFIFYLAHAVGGLTPFFYRLPNLLFHIGNTILILYILEYLINKRVAVFTALIFAVHPILVESVTWIAGGSYASSAFFFLVSFSFYLLSERSEKKIIYWFLTFLFFVISLLFSEKAAIMFLVFPLWEIAFGSLVSKWKLITPYLVLGILLIIAFFNQIAQRLNALRVYNYVPTGLDNPFVKITISITEYLKLIFWPDKLSLYHADLSMNALEFILRLGILLLFLSILGVAYFRARGGKLLPALAFWKKPETESRHLTTEKHIFFWLTFFIISISPTLTPYRIASTVAERYVYLGSLGIFTIASLILDKLARNEKIKTYVYSGFAIIILALSVRTIVRNHDWISEDNLWIASARVSPQSYNVHNNLGDMYARHGEYEKAIEEFSKAIELNPGYADAYHNLGNIQMQLAQNTQSEKYYQEAIQSFLTATGYNPILWQSYQNLGIIYFNIGDGQKAIEYANKAIEVKPSDLNLQYNLGLMYLKLGNPAKARQIFLAILDKDPNYKNAQQILLSPEFTGIR